MFCEVSGPDDATWDRAARPRPIAPATHSDRNKKMKSTGLILLAILGGATPILNGQDAAPPAVDLYPGQKQPDITPTAIPSLEPNGPDVPELSQLDEAFKPKSLGKEADERRLHVEWRQLKNRLAADPELRAAKAAAQAARTDLEKRNGLRNYYNIYYERMSALAPSVEMKLALESLKTAHQNTLNQPRVRPSPTATPAPGASSTPAPTPSAKQKHHKKHGR
jgi:hypothetical protein